MTRSIKSDPHDTRCCDFPEFTRLNYFYGQMLGARDFQAEQDYFRHKDLLHNRCLHGWGVVCGLLVEPLHPPTAPAPPPEAATQQQAQEQPPQPPQEGQYQGPWQQPPPQKEQKEQKEQPEHPHCHQLRVHRGLAIDACGHDLLLREYCDLEGPSEDGQWYVVICYREQLIQRAKAPDACSNYCTYAKTAEKVCITLVKHCPPDDPRCEPCCEPPGEDLYIGDWPCVWLATVTRRDGRIVDVDNSPRRPLSRYHPTTITGVNWVHGARYTEQQAEWRLDRGLKVRFSRDVLTESLLRPGIVDVWITDDWSGPSAGDLRSLTVRYGPFPSRKFVRELDVEVQSRGLKSDERILIILRTDFILDRCCQAVDGNHVGGWVPPLVDDGAGDIPPDVLAQQIQPPQFECPGLPTRVGPWTSGNGVPGGTFESWFFVDGKHKK